MAVSPGFAVAKFLEQFAMPMGAGCLLGVGGLVLLRFRPRLARAFLVLGLGLLWALGTGAAANRLMVPLEKAFPIPASSVRADVAVVLAGTVDLARSTPDRVEFYDRPERLVEGAKLVKQGRARWLVISGGSGDPLRPEAVEAEFLAGFAQELGVSPAVTVVQPRSRTTAEDARYTARLMRERGWVRFFLVTSAFHMPRAVGCFRKAGLEPIPYPVDFRAWPPREELGTFIPTASSLQKSTLSVHEYIGYAVYKLTGRI